MQTASDRFTKTILLCFYILAIFSYFLDLTANLLQNGPKPARKHEYRFFRKFGNFRDVFETLHWFSDKPNLSVQTDKQIDKQTDK